MEFLIKSIRQGRVLKAKGTKCLSLIFINRGPIHGDQPVIKNLFAEKYRRDLCGTQGGQTPTDEQIEQAPRVLLRALGGASFPIRKGGLGEQKRFTIDPAAEGRMLSLDNPVQFIFSHRPWGSAGTTRTLQHRRR